MKKLNEGETLERAALKSGMSENTARRYRKGATRKGARPARAYRTRQDPFEGVWLEVEKMLEVAPGLEAKTIFERLLERPDGEFTEGQLRTLQRKIRRWRAEHGPQKEVMFPQEHRPGEYAQSDYTSMNDLKITIEGERFDHLVYHFVLPYSRWETGMVCFSESFETLIAGFQRAVGELGRVPHKHRTDNLSAATHNLQDGGRAFNERDGEWLCELAEIGQRGARVAVRRQLRAPEPEADLWLLLAPIKRARLDWLVEKATELGAAALVPVMTGRTQPERLNRERLRALAISAAEQSERLSVPDIAIPEPLDRVLAAWAPGRRLVLCDESGAGMPIAQALAGWSPDTPAALLVGPEGGFTDRELDALGKLPIVTRVGLGPRVLRAETAAVAALAVFQAIAGDWRRQRPR